jgi:pimeloyl-ACP methyl ester carboxylesterase
MAGMRLPRPLRRLAVAFAGAVLLWLGWGAPAPARPRHEARWIPAGDVTLRAVEAGHGDTTLLLLHGFGESLLGWRAVFDGLARHYRVIAVDLPGFGLSDKPEGGYDLSGYRTRLGALLEHNTTGPVVVVGHSMGGEVAAALALDHPERVVAAVLIAPAGAGINQLFTDTGGIASPATQWVASAITFVMPVHDSLWLREPEDRRGYEPARDSAAAHAAREILAQFDFAALDSSFTRLRQPVLLIWGRQDPTIPYRIGERIAGMLPCRQVVALNALHRPHQALPDTVLSVMSRFLARPECGSEK